MMIAYPLNLKVNKNDLIYFLLHTSYLLAPPVDQSGIV